MNSFFNSELVAANAKAAMEYRPEKLLALIFGEC